jgi:cell pole-organizing protein PopZ
MRHESEPSVEEILESIKKVIARDNRQTLQAEHRRRESRGVMLAAPEPVEPEPEIDSEDDEDEILDLGDALAEAEAPRPQDAGLTNANSARAMRDSLAALAMISEPGAPPQIVRSGETSLEGLTRDLLKPMLAEWLDRNLPEMVERLVKAEIARIAGKKG